MVVCFDIKVALDYGDDGPVEGEQVPTDNDISNALMVGLESSGFSSVDVILLCAKVTDQ